MRSRFRLICYRRRGGTYYLHDNESGQRTSLETPDKARANELLVAHSEAAREPAFNLQKARVYLAASDPQIITRTWRIALEALTLSKPEGSENRHRWETFAKDMFMVYAKHAEVTVPSLADWEKEWQENPQRNAQLGSG